MVKLKDFITFINEGKFNDYVITKTYKVETENGSKYEVEVEVKLDHDPGYRYNRNGDGLPASTSVDDWKITDITLISKGDDSTTQEEAEKELEDIIQSEIEDDDFSEEMESQDDYDPDDDYDELADYD